MLILTTAYTPSAFAYAARTAAHRITASALTLVAHLFAYLAQDPDDREREREEAYLAQAVDRYDLEYRIHELDRHRTSQPHWQSGHPRWD